MLVKYVKKTSLNYFIVLMIFVVQLGISLLSSIYNYYTKGDAIVVNALGLNFTYLFIIMLLSLAISQAIVLMTSVFDLNKLFGTSNLKSLKDTYLFVVIQIIVLSISFIFLSIIMSNFSSNLPLMHFGMSWHTMDHFLGKFLIVFICLLGVYTISMWFAVGYKKHGVFHGLVRTSVFVIASVNLYSKVLDAASWGERIVETLAVVLVISILSSIYVFYDMIDYERR